MAFDLHLKNKREKIDHHEELLFELINDNEKYPKLNWIWEEFYNGPTIEPEDSNLICHELINLRTKILNDSEYKKIIYTIDRLLPFFSKAYKLGIEIRSSSD